MVENSLFIIIDASLLFDIEYNDEYIVEIGILCGDVHSILTKKKFNDLIENTKWRIKSIMLSYRHNIISSRHMLVLGF